MINKMMMNADVTLTYKPEQTGVDGYNHPVYGDARVVTVKGYYRPRRADTVIGGGSELLKAEAMVFLQPSVDTEDVDSIEVEGMSFYLDGDPMEHWNPSRSRVAYKRLYLRRGSN